MVVNTPQAFATQKSFEAAERDVKGLPLPIKIRIPVDAKGDDKLKNKTELEILSTGAQCNY